MGPCLPRGDSNSKVLSGSWGDGDVRWWFMCYTSALVFAIIGLWPLIGDGPVRIWACAVGTCFLTAAITRPRILAPLNRLWTIIWLFLHRITNFVILTLLFYLVITPMALGRTRGAAD